MIALIFPDHWTLVRDCAPSLAGFLCPARLQLWFNSHARKSAVARLRPGTPSRFVSVESALVPIACWHTSAPPLCGKLDRACKPITARRKYYWGTLFEHVVKLRIDYASI